MDDVDGWFRFFSFFASGPPGYRLRELLALIRAGVVRLVGPDMCGYAPRAGGSWPAAPACQAAYSFRHFDVYARPGDYTSNCGSMFHIVSWRCGARIPVGGWDARNQEGRDAMARLRRGVRLLYSLTRFEADALAVLRFATS